MFGLECSHVAKELYLWVRVQYSMVSSSKAYIAKTGDGEEFKALGQQIGQKVGCEVVYLDKRTA